MDLKRIAREIFTRTLTKVRPDEMIPDRIIYSPEERKMTIHDQTFQLEKGQPLYIIGTGKAAATMALAAEKLFKERSEEHTSELQSRGHLVCRLLLEKKT